MKLIEVTSKREKKNGTRSYAYQIVNKGYGVYYKIIKLTPALGQSGNQKVWYHKVHVRYYYPCMSKEKGLHFHCEASHSTFVGMFRIKDNAMAKLEQMVRDHGNGNIKQWLKFKEKRECLESHR